MEELKPTTYYIRKSKTSLAYLTTLIQLIAFWTLFHCGPSSLCFGNNPQDSMSVNGYTVSFDRPLSEVVPDHDLVTISLSPKTDVQLPYLRVVLESPKTSPWVSTDFPHVEGSTLLDTVFPASLGTIVLKQVFPIRGAYSLKVIPVADNGTNPRAPNLTPGEGETDFVIKINENPEKIQNLSLFLLGLVLICGVSGYVMGLGHRSQQALAIAGAASFLFALGGGWPGLTMPRFSFGFEEKALAHDDEHSPTKSSSSSGPINAEFSGPTGNRFRLQVQQVPQNPRVGELTMITAQVTDLGGQPVPSRFNLKIQQLEHDQEVVSTLIQTKDGKFTWRGSYFDGSPHEVTLEAQVGDSTGQPSEQIKQALKISVDVEALQPPFLATLKSFLLLMVIAGVSLAVGIGIHLIFSVQGSSKIRPQHST